jgi:hypothetical protein
LLIPKLPRDVICLRVKLLLLKLDGYGACHFVEVLRQDAAPEFPETTDRVCIMSRQIL